MKSIQFALVVLLLLVAGQASATVFLRIGAEGGGEDVGILSLDGTRLIQVSTGTGNTFEFGKRIQRLTQNRIDVITEIVVGYKIATSENREGSLDFERYMLSFNRFYGVGPWRAGLGLSLHNNNRMKVEGIGFDSEEQPIWTVNESVGFSAMLDYAFTTNIQLGFKATLLSYHLSDELGNSGLADASTVGVFVNLLLE